MNAHASMLVDTHCHIHSTDYPHDYATVLGSAMEAGVGQMICIGTSGADSEQAVSYASDKPGVFASVGLHPHDAKLGEDELEILARLAGEPKVIAFGEFGLDYYYENSPKKDQLQAFEYQLQLAMSFQKPCIFHVREAFDDFWAVLDNFSGVRGVIHSFTADSREVDRALRKGLSMGVNGIATFTKDQTQIDALKRIPLEKLVLETDAPFLTPTPLRGTVNIPANVRLVAACLAEMRGESLDSLIEATTHNAQTLFSLSKSDVITH